MPHAATAAPPNGDLPASATGAAPATAAVPAADSVASDHRDRSQRWSGAVKKRAVRRFVNKRRRRRSVHDPATGPAAVSDALGAADVSSLETIEAHSSAAMEVDVNAPAQADLFHTAESMLQDDSPLEEYIALCSRLVWPGIQSLRPEQTETLSKLFSDANEEERKLMVNLMTGVGKTHMIRVMGTMLRAVHLIVHPLLVLTADQVVKFLEGTDAYGAIEVHNLDDLAGTTEEYRRQFVKRLNELRGDTQTTIFVFASPKFLAKYQHIRRVLVEDCKRAGTLRSVTIDEAHLFAQHGSSFRPEIRHCAEHVIKPIRKRTPTDTSRPFYVLLSATMSLGDRTTMSKMTDVGFDSEKFIVRGTPSHFLQESITMIHKVGAEFTRHLDLGVHHLQNKASSVFIFANSRRLTNDLVKAFEGKLDKLGIEADVMHIHGKQGKHEKFALIGIFCQKIRVEGYDPRVLIATAASDLGVDHPDAQCVINMEWPECIATLVQRRGRASRQGQAASFILVAGIAAYLSLLRRIYDGLEDVKFNDDDEKDFDRAQAAVNSKVKSPSKRKTAQQKKVASDHELSESDQTALKKRQLNDVRDVLRLMCLNKGCQHKRIAEYLSCGALDNYNGDFAPCDGKCPICAKDWSNDRWTDNYLPVSREGLLLFFRRETGLGQTATYDNLVKLVWDNETWIEQIFDLKKRTICKYNVEAMFLQLIAAGILDARPVRRELKWVLSRQTNSVVSAFTYESVANWSGISLMDPTKKRNHKLLV